MLKRQFRQNYYLQAALHIHLARNASTDHVASLLQEAGEQIARAEAYEQGLLQANRINQTGTTAPVVLAVSSRRVFVSPNPVALKKLSGKHQVGLPLNISDRKSVV